MLKGWIAANHKTGATVATLVNDPDLIAVIQTAVDEAQKKLVNAQNELSNVQKEEQARLSKKSSKSSNSSRSSSPQLLLTDGSTEEEIE
jgi:hypothetical protein